jgi:hypothetical protein
MEIRQQEQDIRNRPGEEELDKKKRTIGTGPKGKETRKVRKK